MPDLPGQLRQGCDLRVVLEPAAHGVVLCSSFGNGVCRGFLGETVYRRKEFLAYPACRPPC